MHLEIDDLTRPEVLALLEEHLANMYAITPPDQVFALDVTRLRAPDITFWTAWNHGELMGCGALKELTLLHGEIKSMRTPQARRGRGAGRAILTQIIETAQQRGYATLSLETGPGPAFEPAQKLYETFGFLVGGPFGDYVENEHSVFMARPVRDA